MISARSGYCPIPKMKTSVSSPWQGTQVNSSRYERTGSSTVGGGIPFDTALFATLSEAIFSVSRRGMVLVNRSEDIKESSELASRS